MAESMELEIPETGDDGVVEAIKALNRQLRTDLMKNYLKLAGDQLYLATNATAKDAEQQIKVQSCLFNAVKLCDAWNLMLTSFKVGANDILEKLHIAYLKLLDGFPDFALADVESVTKHISSMKAACRKAGDSFAKGDQELASCITFLEGEKQKLGGRVEASSQGYKVEQKRLKGALQNQFPTIQEEELKNFYKVMESERDQHHVVQRKIQNCILAKRALEKALEKLNEAVAFLAKEERLVNDWYNECREVVEKRMKSNVKQAGKMSEAKQKDFWKPLPMIETAYNYLCRWKALQQICQGTSVHMRRVRGDIDWYYTENLYPAEAEKKAWELKGHYPNMGDIKPYPDMVVPTAKRNQTLCYLPELMKLPDKSDAPSFKFEEFKTSIENLNSYLSVLESLNTGSSTNEVNRYATAARKNVTALVTKMNDFATAVNRYSQEAIMGAHLASLSILDGMQGAANHEVSLIWREENAKKLELHIQGIYEDLNSLNCRDNSYLCTQLRDRISEMMADLKKKVEVVIRAKHEAKDDVTADIVKLEESIKLSLLSIELLNLVAYQQLPWKDINEVYSTVSNDLRQHAVRAKEALESQNQGEKVQEWQERIVGLLMRLKDIHHASGEQITQLKKTTEILNKPSYISKWEGCMKIRDQGMREIATGIQQEVAKDVKKKRDGVEEVIQKEQKGKRKRLEEVERKRQEEAERRRQEEAERRRQEEAERRRQEEAERRRQEEAERSRREEAGRKRQEDVEWEKTLLAQKVAKDLKKKRDGVEEVIQKEQKGKRKRLEEVERKRQEEAERRRQEEAEGKRQKESERRRQEEAERRRQEEAERKRQKESERRRQEEAERRRQEEAERRRQEEAERKRQKESERRRQEEAERRRQEEAERRRQEEAERRRQEEAERRRQEEAERRRQAEAEWRRQEEAERRRQEESGRKRQEDVERVETLLAQKAKRDKAKIVTGGRSYGPRSETTSTRIRGTGQANPRNNTKYDTGLYTGEEQSDQTRKGYEGHRGMSFERDHQTFRSTRTSAQEDYQTRKGYEGHRGVILEKDHQTYGSTGTGEEDTRRYHTREGHRGVKREKILLPQSAKKDKAEIVTRGGSYKPVSERTSTGIRGPGQAKPSTNTKVVTRCSTRKAKQPHWRC